MTEPRDNVLIRVRDLHRGYHAGYEDEYDRQIRELLR